MDPSKPHGGSKTPIILLVVSIIMTFVFIGAVIIFFVFFNKNPSHNIIITNSNTSPVTAIVGALISNGNISYLPNHVIAPGQSFKYQSTPGTTLVIQGSLKSSETQRTMVYLNLAGAGFASTTVISDGQTVITGLARNEFKTDDYGVSVQKGYNIPIIITSTAFNNRDPANAFSCVGPVWTQNVICPGALQGTGSCLSACQAIGGLDYCCQEHDACQIPSGCESLWPDQDFYHVYASACPNCLITNCDTNNYSCGSVGGLSQYSITFQ